MISKGSIEPQNNNAGPGEGAGKAASGFKVSKSSSTDDLHHQGHQERRKNLSGS